MSRWRLLVIAILPAGLAVFAATLSYRHALVVLSVAIAIPHVCFLISFRPPLRRWALVSSMRLLSFSLFVTGIRTAWLYANTSDGKVIPGFWNHVVSVSMLGLVAVASWMHFMVYLHYRTWGPGETKGGKK